MLLTIDIGNTNMVFGIYKGEEMLGSFRLSTNSTATSDELGILAVSYFERFGYRTEDLKACIIGSVVPQVMYSVTSAIIKYFGVEPLVVGTDVDTGLKFAPRCYETGRLGADRAINCIAATQKYGAPFVILDFGTATTVDAVDAGGVYVGGSICPGVRVSMDALAQNAAMLPHVELNLPDKMLGYDTISQIQAGIVGGYVGSMEYLIRRTKAEMAEPDEQIKVVATGGLARMIADHTDTIDLVDSELILDGLVSIYQKHKAAQQSQ